jgi:hypothetical protein
MVSIDPSFISSAASFLDPFSEDSDAAEASIERRTATRKVIDLIIVIVDFCVRGE